MSTDDMPQSERTRAGSRREQAEATRELLLRTAERLIAERGLAQVSSRQIVEAAGQANNSALAYHVGSRTDLIHAISLSHAEPIARRTWERVERARGSTDPRDHVASLVLPYIEHVAELGNPSWCARFTAQIAADPAFAGDARSDPRLASYFDEGLEALAAHLPELPEAEAEVRRQATRMAIIHTCADEERAAAESGTPADWELIGAALTDAVAGLLLAPRRG
ncbi:TetR/AcrR family transcriptional regulator [Saccharopolyspora sp. MS10]|uniref:TetR/AcrR family transcriptional regulator n=1 Tax=Saccharopolyspora sp. MS10 TaxID=3385973 RepID=UPI0039A3ACC0